MLLADRGGDDKPGADLSALFDVVSFMSGAG